jgi:hypothetical protein
LPTILANWAPDQAESVRSAQIRAKLDRNEKTCAGGPTCEKCGTNSARAARDRAKRLMSSTKANGRSGAGSGAIDEASTANAVLWLTAALGCYLIVYYFIGERVPYNGGLGFDGYFYGTLAQDVPGVLGQRVPEYYLDRILPSVIVWLSAKSLGFSLARPDQVVGAFHIYDSILLVAASLAWARLSRTLKLSVEVATIGWACLFLNWTILKQYLYFAVQTDTTALTLGVCAALCAIERRPLLLAVVAVIASFVWKTVMPMTALLILFPHPTEMLDPTKVRTQLAAIVPIAGAVVVGAIAIYVTLILHFRVEAGAAQVDLNTLPLSVLVLSIYVYYVARSAPLARIAASFRIGGLGAIAFFFGLWGLRALFLSIMFKLFGTSLNIMPLSTFVSALFASPVAKPALFLIGMVVAFGPGFLLLLWHLPRVMGAAAAHSFGALLLVIVTMALAMNTESRDIVFLYPLLIAFLCAALQEAGVERRFTIVFLACSLVVSKAYLPLNLVGMGAISSTERLTDVGVLMQFPWQWFLMNIGIYMGWIAYAVNAALTIGAAVVLFVVRPRRAAVVKLS